MNCTDWAPKPTIVRFPEEGRIDVWRVSLLQETAGQLWSRILSEEEHLRASRFSFEKDRHTYTTTRGILRTLLGQYLAIAPEEISFVVNGFGKPSLDPLQNSRRITFNVSHSHHYALLAFSAAVDLGVDIEHLWNEKREEIAHLVFSQAEQDWLLGLPAADRARAFLRLWTHKEALVKAVGCGLSVPLQSIEVALPPAEPARLLQGVPEMGDVSEWSFCDLNADAAYAAALAVRSRKFEMRLWDWR